MITDEQICIACAAYDGADVAHSQLADMRKALEAYEQSKPKPEPVGYIYKHRLEQMLGSEVDNDCNFFPIKDDISRTIFNRKRDKYLAFYEEPPAQEPLSEEEIEKLVPWQGDPKDPFFNRIEFARAIEQAHGII